MKKMDTQLYSDPDSNKAHKNRLKEEMLQVINENFIEMFLNMVNLSIQEALKKFQDNKNKEYEKTQKLINEIVEALYKCQTETETTRNR
jgi:hypothetical protein